MFSKIFGQKEVPINEGKLVSKPLTEKFRFIKVFDLELTNMEGAPNYTLRHQLTVGSEIGNIVISDSTISPRHCTFVLDQELVSVIDHGSLTGTIINGVKIQSGKYIILEESDEIKVGDLSIKLKERAEKIDEFDIPLIPIDGQEAHQNKIEDESRPKLDSVDLGVALKNAEIKLEAEENLKNKVAAVNSTSHSVNTLVRVFAVIGDMLWAYIFSILLYPFDDFKSFLSLIPTTIEDLVGISFSQVYTDLHSQSPQMLEALKEGYEYLSASFHIEAILVLFIAVRLISTIVFGVSISEKIMSVKFEGNAIWARFGGILRVIIGLITGPLLIFDIPAIISRRTFKEVITYTHTDLSSKFVAVLGIILYIPLLIFLSVLSPLFQGLDLPVPITVNDKIEMKARVVKPAQTEPTSDVEIAQFVSMDSKFFNAQISYNPSDVSVIPLLKHKRDLGNLKIIPQVYFYQNEFMSPVVFEVFKNFNQKELLEIAMKGNFFLFEKFPKLYDLIYGTQAPGLYRPLRDEKEQDKFANEFINLTKISFELGLENFTETMELYSIFLKNFLDYKASFLGLIEYQDFQSITHFKLGNTVFMKIHYEKAKPFDLIIPLIKGEGKIFKVTFSKKENYIPESNKFYKYTLDGSDWLLTSYTGTQEIMSPFHVIDFFTRIKQDDLKNLSSKDAQALYGYYFEKSSQIILKDQGTLYDLWKDSLDSTNLIIGELAQKLKRSYSEGETPDSELAIIKLEQNFNDLKSAYESKNKNFFAPNQLSI